MPQVEMKAIVGIVNYGTMRFEFGRVQANMTMSDRGKAARALKLKEGDKVTVIIKKG